MRELGRIFRTLCSDKHTKWARYISDIEFFINATTNCSTGFSPHELHFGVHCTDEIKEIVKFPQVAGMTKDYKIILARENLQRNFDNRARNQRNPSEIRLNEGDFVLLHVPRQSDALKSDSQILSFILWSLQNLAESW